ncbi:MAG TPA: ABC transporter ATP-binding protein [Methanocorpusculum sp.]|nr:ABC transporter ATP-binding protein [Methanocorpusculum sp.]
MTPVISIRNLSVYYDRTPALTDISLDIEEGEFVGILGPNGGGKSTLAKALLGLIPIQSGTIELFGGKVIENRSKIGYVPQFSEVDRQFPITVEETVLTGLLSGDLHPFFQFRRSDREQALFQMGRMGIAHLASRRISDLSGGEFQRVLIARALAGNPSLLLLDETDASIDPAFREQIYALLHELNKTITIVLITHDHLAVTSMVSSLICLHQKIIYQGSSDMPDSVFHELYKGFA